MKINGAALCMAYGVLLLLPAGAGGQTDRFEPVTDAVLQDPDPGDWLNYRRTLDGWGYSPLDQIDRGNVHELQLVWSWALAPGISEPTPLVYDGVMYLPDGGGSGILALDAVTGELLWEYHKEFEEPPDLILLNPLRRRTRNIAIYGERIYWISYDAHLIALDARTGALVWDRTLVDFRHGYRMTSGPIVVNGLIVSGLAGCDRFQTDKCFISAYDAETGERVWSTPTIALPGQPGDWSWGDVPALERAGGDAWIPGSYDPELGLIYWATAQAKPFTRFQRGTTGDVLFTNSVLALDPETGEMVWYRQLLPGETHDQDEVYENVLVDHDGRRSVFKFGKIGILWEVDRESGAFVAAHDPGYQTLIDVDAEGRVTYRPGMIPEPGVRLSWCPSHGGFKNWQAMAYHPETEAFYIPLFLHCSESIYEAGGIEAREGGGGMGRSNSGNMRRHPRSPDALGELLAMDVNGEILWRHRMRSPATTAALTTAGGLVVVGDWDRNVRVLDVRTGDLLFRTRLPNGVQGFPITYAVGGRQYLAVPTGQLDAGGRASNPLRMDPELRRPPVNANGIFVFAVPERVGAVSLQSPDLPGMVRVTIEVELSCPSCAAGLERRLRRLDYVAGVEVNPPDGQIVIAVEPGRHLDLAAVSDTVRNVGFVPDDVAVTAIGHVTDVNGIPALALSPDYALPLVTADGLTVPATEAGDRLVRVTGRWIAPRDGAARLQVESLEVR